MNDSQWYVTLEPLKRVIEREKKVKCIKMAERNQNGDEVETEM